MLQWFVHICSYTHYFILVAKANKMTIDNCNDSHHSSLCILKLKWYTCGVLATIYVAMQDTLLFKVRIYVHTYTYIAMYMNPNSIV